MSNPIFDLAQKRKTLLAAHRGVNGGNIPCNSLEAFQIALNEGADIVELDVESSSDGKLFIQHPKKEPMHLRLKDSIRLYPSEFVKELYLSNPDHNRTNYHIPRLEEALDLLNGKCYINVDKFWCNPKEIQALIKERHMEDQIIVKTKYEAMDIAALEEFAEGLNFMPVVRDTDPSLDVLDSSKIRHIGSEVLFSSDDAAVASKEYVEKMHDAEKVIWVNPILYNTTAILTGTHTDDIAIVREPEHGWGWLADRGFDILQTDWITQARRFLLETGRRTE